MSSNTKYVSNEYVEDFFLFNRRLLKFAGLWRPKTQNRIVQTLYKTYSSVAFLFANLFFIATEFAMLFETYKNEYDFLKNIGFALTHLMGAVKVIFWYLKGNELRKIMQILEDKDLHYTALHDYQPEVISKRYKRVGFQFSLLFLTLAHGTLLSSYIPPTMAAIKHIHVDGNLNTTLFEKLPYYSWMPFRYDTGPRYLLAIAYQAGPMLSHAYSIVGMDTLFMNLMNCIGCNLNIIQGAFATIRERSLNMITGPPMTLDGHHNSEELMRVMNEEIKKVCKHLQIIYKACKDLENLYRYVTLAQSIATVFILCTCLYLVSTTPFGSKQFYAETVYMLAMSFQLIMFCWFGNEITLKSLEMPIYIWKTDWLAADKPFKFCMIMTMARTKKPVYMTAGKFAPLTLATFMAIVKTSYSVFTLIKNTSDT